MEFIEKQKHFGQGENDLAGEVPPKQASSFLFVYKKATILQIQFTKRLTLARKLL